MNPVPVIDAINAATQASKNPYIATAIIIVVILSLTIVYTWKSMTWTSRNEKKIQDLTDTVNGIVTGKNSTKNEAVTMLKNGYQDQFINEASEMARSAMNLAIENARKIEMLDTKFKRIEKDLSAITRRIDEYQIDNKKDSSSISANIKLLLQMVSNIDTPINPRTKNNDKKSN